MKPENKSKLLLGSTRSKAKMLEFHIPEESHINLAKDPARLFTLSIGLLGNLAARINNKENIYDDPEIINNLLFSAHFFDSYLKSKLNKSLDFYLMLIGSASYYLCDLPGSSMVMVSNINTDHLDLGGESLENLLLWLLRNNLSTPLPNIESLFSKHINLIYSQLTLFFKDGIGENELISSTTNLRAATYEYGTSRQLLFGDIISAIVRKKIHNSCWNTLPLYSGLPQELWQSVLKKSSFITELWPAQHLLGQQNILKGASAVIKMPTSAGKTKSTELIIRSAFLAARTSLAIIIAPFRALCHEIKNSFDLAFFNETIQVDELSDVLQTDYEITAILGHKQILIVTPEKLLYVLRHTPNLAENIGLLIFDEGHQFDNIKRGISYELLLTSLRSMVPINTQMILISAVVSNADALGEWLNKSITTVNGQNLLPTYRSIAFCSFMDLNGLSIKTGWIKYVDPQVPDKLEYFVPQVIEKMPLNTNKVNLSNKISNFPNPENSQEIAIYLGLKLVKEGPVAIFCGRKDTASRLCKIVSDKLLPKLKFTPPTYYSDVNEISRLSYIIEQNLGSNSNISMSAKIGVFSHHSNIPQGIRLAVEHAMHKGLIRFVICTSTLAQGVNLPIRYLIMTSFYQGKDRIKVRDFHNLMGRVARAGMHTEGTVLFADPKIYDKRKIKGESWRWQEIKKILDPENSEPCVSNLLSIFDPIKSNNGKSVMLFNILDFVRLYTEEKFELSSYINELIQQSGSNEFSYEQVANQLSLKINLIASIESFLLSHWDKKEKMTEQDVISLAGETLAYFLADEERQSQIKELFKILALNILFNFIDPFQRSIYGRMLYGLKQTKQIEQWLQANVSSLINSTSDIEFINFLWPIITLNIHNSIFSKFDKPEVLKTIAINWISGKSFHELLVITKNNQAKLMWGTKFRNFTIEHIIEICENGLSYEGSFLIGALCELVELLVKENSKGLINRLQFLQKQFKYGLPTPATIALYELGFSDRTITNDLATTLRLSNEQKRDIINSLKSNRNLAKEVINKYPLYFQDRMNAILS